MFAIVFVLIFAIWGILWFYRYVFDTLTITGDLPQRASYGAVICYHDDTFWVFNRWRQNCEQEECNMDHAHITVGAPLNFDINPAVYNIQDVVEHALYHMQLNYTNLMGYVFNNCYYKHIRHGTNYELVVTLIINENPAGITNSRIESYHPVDFTGFFSNYTYGEIYKMISEKKPININGTRVQHHVVRDVYRYLHQNDDVM